MNNIREITFAEALVEAMREEMKRDKNVFLIGEDIGNWGGVFGATKGLLEEFGGERVLDTPISESAIVGASIGASLIGMKPIAEIMYIDFITIAMDQIVNHAAKLRYMSGGQLKVPIVIRTQGGAGRNSASQHSQSMEAWFINVPGLIVVMPSNSYDAKGLLKTAIRNNDPVIFIEHKMLYRSKGHVPEEEYLIPFGKADIKKSGDDITVISISRMVDMVLKASEGLCKEGIEVEVIDPRTLVPLDEETIINSVKKTGKCVIVHEAPKTGGVGAEIASRIMEKAFDYLDAPVIRIAGLDVPIPYEKSLEDFVCPDEERIIQEIKNLCK